MDEFEIIRQFFQRESTDESVLVGIGDDGAVTRAADGRDIVTVIDTMVSGVHFPAALHASDIGFRAVAVNLSDIAAMGATPKWMTLALTLSEADSAWLTAFSKGLFAAADEHGVALVGGDTTRGNETVVTVQIAGEIEAETALLRSGANAGDAIYVTGTIGDAAAGLSILQSGAPRNDNIDFLVQRFSRPQARVEFGRAISAVATSAIDLSDGLFTDIEKLMTASGLSGVIELNEIPLSAQLRATVSADDALRFALGGGDDYELGFTSSASGTVIQEIAGKCNVSVTRIGSFAEGEGLACTLDGESHEFRHAGYRHFH